MGESWLERQGYYLIAGTTLHREEGEAVLKGQEKRARPIGMLSVGGEKLCIQNRQIFVEGKKGNRWNDQVQESKASFSTIQSRKTAGGQLTLAAECSGED